MLEAGKLAPDFTLPDYSGQLYTLSNLKGKKVVLYFYPKDDTPGCTTQACSFRDLKTEYDKRGVVVIGVSKDSQKSHQKFVSGHGLNFILLSDESLEVLKAYGAYGEKKLYGKSFMGIIRCTFVIDENEQIQKVFKKASAKTNAENKLQYLEQ